MNISYPKSGELLGRLRKTPDGFLDFVILSTGEGTSLQWGGVRQCLDEAVRALATGGLLFVQGSPRDLAELGVYLDGRLTFRYWIAVESELRRVGNGLPSSHAGILLFAKGRKLPVKRTRTPHLYCSACGKSLRDWGGKTHLMHPDGRVISDVWRELPPADNYSSISEPVLERILAMMEPDEEADGMISSLVSAGRPVRVDERQKINRLSPDLVNVTHCGDALDVLSRYPSNSVDLVFADPPYNLEKKYNTYEDRASDEEYFAWCEAWLSEYVRILKPNGALWVVNLPRNAMHHAEYLNKHLYFQNWIVWSALSDPRGKLMPAHYSLIYYTKHPTSFTMNYDEVKRIDARDYCLRPTCVKQRKAAGDDRKEMLNDFWTDVHRIRHKRDRDYHPCQLPDALLERIIRLSTNPGDIVLDALCGVGTTQVVAAKLERRYVGIDIDPQYVDITCRKVSEVEAIGKLHRARTKRNRTRYTKKELHLELRRLAGALGRLPTPEDVRSLSHYDPDVILDIFPTWNRALAAAKLDVGE